MNWLAHVLLSEPDIEFRLGNLLADLVKGRDRAGMSAAFVSGMKRHQVIDAFTDYHPIVHRSRARIGDEYDHVRGILVDVFYDHFLALDWARYCPVPLETFTANLYTEIRAHPIALPEEARAAVERMMHEDRLGSYRRLAGIESSLKRVSIRLSARLSREFALERAVSELVDNFDGLAGDFEEFFPELQAHVARDTVPFGGPT
jgi:acyl carrier protein phosphodiesterase